MSAPDLTDASSSLETFNGLPIKGEGAELMSIAISLKRIADCLCGTPANISLVEHLGETLQRIKS